MINNNKLIHGSGKKLKDFLFDFIYLYLQQQQRTMMKTMRIQRAPAATPMIMDSFCGYGTWIPGAVKVRVTFFSAMPPLLMATQEYWPRSLLVTEVTVRLKFRSMPPTRLAFVKTYFICLLGADVSSPYPFFCYAKFMFCPVSQYRDWSR